jgi:hypothetical protein
MFSFRNHSGTAVRVVVMFVVVTLDRIIYTYFTLHIVQKVMMVEHSDNNP